MYGQSGRREHREVNLVRMSPHDSRTNRQRKGRRRRRKAQRSAILLAFSLFLIVSCMGTLYYVLHLDAQESTSDGKTGISQEDLSGIILDDPEEILPKVTEEPKPTQIPPEEETPLVAIDPGHGGVDGGSGRGSVLEKEVNLEIALRLEDKLQEMGFETIMIREDNETTVSKQDRVVKANEAKADVYISIHQNTYEDSDNEVSGIETYYCNDTEGSKEFAQLVHDSVVAATGARDGNLRESDGLYVVREADMPSCLVECSFLTNKKEREAIASAEYQEKLAAGMAEAIYDFFYQEDK